MRRNDIPGFGSALAPDSAQKLAGWPMCRAMREALAVPANPL